MPTHSPEARASRKADLAVCRGMLQANSRTFYMASLLLPRDVRGPACALYAFCRIADDEVDINGGQLDAIDQLRKRLHLAYAGRPLPLPVDRALADVVQRFAVPRALPEALIEGFEWDAQGRRYEDYAALQAYAARVAGAVGAMMALLMGTRSPAALARACDLGVAMQLTNIARDVGEDARAGRLYLPRDWMREAGLDPDAWLAAPVFNARLATVIARTLHEADVLYNRVAAGVAQLPPSCRPGINAARSLYAEIGRELERDGLDSVRQRTVVPGRRKLWLLARAPFMRTALAAADHSPPLQHTRFLVEAVAPWSQAPAAQPLRGGARWWQVGARLAWLIHLFERLEHQDRRMRSSGPA
jgi:phytoene synthase